MVPVPGCWFRHLFLPTYNNNIAEKRDLQDRGILRVSPTELMCIVAEVCPLHVVKKIGIVRKIEKDEIQRCDISSKFLKKNDVMSYQTVFRPIAILDKVSIRRNGFR